ncbi:MAG: VanZ family protein [Pseudomonadota bacterium]
MISALKWIALGSYWTVLTRSLLMTCPWELFSQSLADNPPFDISFEPTSWILHLSAYSFLGFLIREAADEKKKLAMGLFVLGFFHSIGCEFLQYLVPGRWPNVWDAVSNTLGLMLAFGLHKALRPFLIATFPWRTSRGKLAA